jgi:tetratricopeptide (TPR) repeat protein
LDTGNLAVAKSQLKIIQSKFPATSSRVFRLTGMVAEAEGNDDRALAIYRSALENDENSPPIRKRVIALQWASGDRTLAIESLVRYLDTYMQDFEGWMELSSMYLAEGLYQQAAFCVEELIVMRPSDHLLHIRYADIMRTLGKDELALKYYCSALEISKDQTRALYGLRLVTSSLIEKGGVHHAKGKAGGAKEVALLEELGDVPSLETLKALHKLAGDRLTALYDESAKEASSAGKKAATELHTIVKSWLNQ